MMLSIRNLLFVRAIGAAVLVSFSVLLAQATPVTLQFEAIIGPPRQGVSGDFELPFSFAEGDAIGGTYTFEPLDVPSEVNETFVIQQFPLTFVVEGFSFSAANYTLSVVDDISGLDQPIPTDVIRFFSGFCNTETCTPDFVNGTDGPQFGFAFAFFADSDLLHGADIPSDPEVWSRFDFDENSSITLTIRDDASGEFRGFRAKLTSVRTIPEPASHVTLLTLWMAIFMMGRRRNFKPICHELLV